MPSRRFFVASSSSFRTIRDFGLTTETRVVAHRTAILAAGRRATTCEAALATMSKRITSDGIALYYVRARCRCSRSRRGARTGIRRRQMLLLEKVEVEVRRAWACGSSESGAPLLLLPRQGDFPGGVSATRSGVLHPGVRLLTSYV